MNKTLLIYTDGFSISVFEFETKEEAIAEMKRRYNQYASEDNENALEDMSYCEECDACFADGETVHVWRVYNVMKG